MNYSPARTILLPAILTAGTVFGLLTSIVATHQLRMDTQVLSASSSLPQYALREQQRNFAIRNIGLCILTSAASGLVVAGGIRKLHATRKHTQLKHQAVSGLITEFLSSKPE